LKDEIIEKILIKKLAKAKKTRMRKKFKRITVVKDKS
jgi:hypothetical protein